MDKTLTLDEMLDRWMTSAHAKGWMDGYADRHRSGQMKPKISGLKKDAKKALQELVKEAIPSTKKEEAGIERGMLNRRIGYNQAVTDIEKNLKKAGLL